jgi:arylsulfatase A-like enzyme
MAGANVPEGIESQSLVPLLQGETDKHRAEIGAVYRDIQRMWTDGEWKLIRYYRRKNGDGVNRVQLFHIKEDPHELRDLSREPEHAERVQEMLQQLSVWQKANGDFLD